MVNGPNGEAVHINRVAHAIAARHDGLWLSRDGRLNASNAAVQNAIAREVANVMAGGAGGIVHVPRAPLPASAAQACLDGRAAGGALTLIHDPDATIASDAETIAATFRLPPATARVVEALMRGEDAKAYAERTDVSYETVRYHLKSAFARTGARSQARLFQLVTRALAELRGRL